MVGDDDGIVVSCRRAAELDAAEALQTTEVSMLASIQSGDSLFSRLDYEEHLARLRAGEDSALSSSAGLDGDADRGPRARPVEPPVGDQRAPRHSA